ncbi:hypothetical protein [Bradyrhizobium sp. 2TAF24]|uniref:hypothetical protein n=1 Tax=Bradyrhizobium sp. 2TAF24 TaxID=3233011 RepID=UPI003F90F10E
MRFAIAVLLVAATAIGAQGASAQSSLGLGPTPPSMIMPPPPSPPPPKIEVPVVPKMNAPLPPPKANLQSRGSFSDRVAPCLDQGAAAGLGPNERAAYSRGCANQ